MMRLVDPAAILLILSCSAGLFRAADLGLPASSALPGDDECAVGSGGEGCALNALQHRGLKKATMAVEANENVSASKSGCSQAYNGFMPTEMMNCVSTGICCDAGVQCYEKTEGSGACLAEGTCTVGINYMTELPMYWKPWSCTVLPQTAEPAASQSPGGAQAGPAPMPAPPVHTVFPPHGAGCGKPSNCLESVSWCYKKNWEAKGKTFFNNFTFMTESDTHGAEWYGSRDESWKEGLVSADDGEAIIRTGPAKFHPDGKVWKRRSVKIHSNQAWDPMSSFLVAMHFSHAPEGCGVWPAFWTLNTDLVWPGGAELDMFEYASDFPSKVSFHTGVHPSCKIDSAKVNKCTRQSIGQSGLNCGTDYYSAQKQFGCVVNKEPKLAGATTGPGVMAGEWTPTYIKVFYIPESEIPSDLTEDAPRPTEWDKWLIGYYPFDSDCIKNAKNIMKPQEIVLNLALCGDWAGSSWDTNSRCPMMTGVTMMTLTCKNDVFDPAADCCTKYVANPAQDAYMHDHAYWGVKSMKVFTGEGDKSEPYLSQTFRASQQ